MSNRHERRRAMKIVSYEQITMTLQQAGDLLNGMECGCAWAGCNAHTRKPGDHGWSSMLLYKGKTKLDFMKIDPRLMARDSVLCPEHARFIDEHLLVDIGGRLREVAGSA